MIKTRWDHLQSTIAASANYKWWVLAVVQFGIFFVGVIGTIVNIALPQISQAFSSASAPWIIVSYSITLTSFLPIAGKLPKYFGSKPVIIGGFLLFTGAALFSALAPSLTYLIVLQIPLAIGSAALLANSNALTYKVFPRRQHGLAMGVNGTVASIGYGAGLLLGGYLVELFNWRAIFWFNLPFGLIALILASFILVEEKIAIPHEKPRSFDYLGSFLFMFAVISCLLSLNANMRDYLWLFLVSGVTALFFFIYWERKARFPLIDVRLFKLASFNIGSATRLLMTLIVSSCLFLLPFYAQNILKLSVFESGLRMAPFSLALFCIGPLGGALSDKIGTKFITTLGFIFCLISLLILLSLTRFFSEETYQVTIPTGMFFLGLGFGLFVPSNNSNTLGMVPPEEVGLVSGFLWSMAYFGVALGTAFSSLLVSQIDVFESAQRLVFTSLLPICFVGIFLCCNRPERAR